MQYKIIQMVFCCSNISHILSYISKVPGTTKSQFCLALISP